MKPCHDCGARVGMPHEDGCDVARCMWSGGQRLSCLMSHDCGEDVWTGQWPGEAEAVEMGLWCCWGPPWIECEPGHPGARPDLNRVAIVGRWDRDRKRWVRR